MDLILWKEELVPDMDTVLGRADEGARYLDGRVGTDWICKIDLDRLDIAGLGCVLGQLGGQGYFCLPSPVRLSLTASRAVC